MLDPRWQAVAERILAWITEQKVENAAAHVASPAVMTGRPRPASVEEGAR
jgi:hypothetical protein